VTEDESKVCIDTAIAAIGMVNAAPIFTGVMNNKAPINEGTMNANNVRQWYKE
jgi:hypothetical protein